MSPNLGYFILSWLCITYHDASKYVTIVNTPPGLTNYPSDTVPHTVSLLSLATTEPYMGIKTLKYHMDSGTESPQVLLNRPINEPLTCDAMQMLCQQWWRSAPFRMSNAYNDGVSRLLCDLLGTFIESAYDIKHWENNNPKWYQENMACGIWNSSPGTNHKWNHNYRYDKTWFFFL